MKRLKPVLLAAAIVVGLLIVGIVVVIATFDVDRYRPLVAQRLQDALGRPVDLGRLSLAWHQGLAMRCDGVTIHADASKAGEPLLQMDSASATVRLLPLLRRQIEIPVVTVRGAAMHWRDPASPSTEVSVKSVDLTATLGRLPSDPAQLEQVDAGVRVTDGIVRLSSLAGAVESIRLDAVMKGGRVELRSLSAKLAGGTIHATGRIEHLSIQPRTTVKVTVEKALLQRLLPATAPEAPQLSGSLSLSFEGVVHGLTAEDLRRTLAGSGRLTLTDGKVANLNVLRDVFERLSLLPGLVQKLQSRLPEASQRHLQARDTLLQPVNVSVTVADGAITLHDVQVASEAFALRGDARLQLDRTLTGQMMLAVEPGFSSAIVRSVKELQALTDSDGRLTLPVLVQSRLPQVSVLPDIGYVASHLLMTKTRDWLGSVLEGALAPPEASSSDGSTPPAR